MTASVMNSAERREHLVRRQLLRAERLPQQAEHDEHAHEAGRHQQHGRREAEHRQQQHHLQGRRQTFGTRPLFAAAEQLGREREPAPDCSTTFLRRRPTSVADECERRRATAATHAATTDEVVKHRRPPRACGGDRRRSRGGFSRKNWSTTPRNDVVALCGSAWPHRPARRSTSTRIGDFDERFVGAAVEKLTSTILLPTRISCPWRRPGNGNATERLRPLPSAASRAGLGMPRRSSATTARNKPSTTPSAGEHRAEAATPPPLLRSRRHRCPAAPGNCSGFVWRELRAARAERSVATERRCGASPGCGVGDEVPAAASSSERRPGVGGATTAACAERRRSRSATSDAERAATIERPTTASAANPFATCAATG